MPFVITLEQETDGRQLYSIGIDNVDREHDRLAVVLCEADGTESTIVCILEDGEFGEPELLIDRERSDQDFFAELDDALRATFGIDTPEALSSFVITDTLTDSTDLMLTIPPSVRTAVNRRRWMTGRYETDNGTIRLESQTIS